MQILVVVANIQVRTLKAEVEKGFMVTAVDHELVDPKPQVNPANNVIVSAMGHSKVTFARRKGVRLIFLNLDMHLYGNVSELGDVSRCPGKSSLFFLTVQMTLESCCMEIGLDDW